MIMVISWPYLLAWLVYFFAAASLTQIYRFGFARFLPKEWRSVVMVVLVVMLFTPWPIDGAHLSPTPAIMAVLFHLLEHSGIDALKGLFPLLLLLTVISVVGWVMTSRQET